VHRFEVVVRIVQKLEQLDGVVKVCFVSYCTYELIHRQLVEHPVESLFIGHSY
jgi:hypothetical protein